MLKCKKKEQSEFTSTQVSLPLAGRSQCKLLTSCYNYLSVNVILPHFPVVFEAEVVTNLLMKSLKNLNTRFHPIY